MWRVDVGAKVMHVRDNRLEGLLTALSPDRSVRTCGVERVPSNQQSRYYWKDRTALPPSHRGHVDRQNATLDVHFHALLFVLYCMYP
jgi:hypothetical protein